MAFRHSLVRVSQFDLSSTSEWDLGKILAVGDSIPAYRYSATFLSTLRSNIHLSTHSDLCSHPTTPTMSTFSSSHLTHPNPSPLSLPATTTSTTTFASPPASSHDYQPDPLPALSTYPTISIPDRTSALHLIADSIAQQRQQTSYTLITHPYPLSATILLLGILSQYLDPYTFVTTAAGVIMALLVVVRWIASPYISLAEGINFGWLEGAGVNLPGKKKSRRGHSRSSSTGSNSSTGGNVEPAPSTVVASTTGKSARAKRSRNNSNSSRAQESKDVENVVIITKWGGEEIIGALVMRVLRMEKKAVMRAWTVKGRYRGHGVGRGLLEEGVRVAREMGCGDGLDFDRAGHANSHRVLPEMFNKGFERREKQARKMLDEVVAEQGLGK